MMHDVGAVLQISNSLTILLTIDVKDSLIKIKVFFVKDVFFIIIGVLFITIIHFVITAALIELVRVISLQLTIKLSDLFIIQL